MGAIVEQGTHEELLVSKRVLCPLFITASLPQRVQLKGIEFRQFYAISFMLNI